MCKRGEIYYADFGVGVGSEQGGRRPCVVIQNDKGNTYSPTTIVVALTASLKSYLPTHVEVSGYGLEKPSTILCEQVRTLSKKRLSDRLGKLDAPMMKKVDKALLISVINN